MELALTQSTMILKWKCKNASVLKLIIFEFEFFNMHTSYEHPTKRYINEERSKRKSIKFSFPKTRSLHGVPCTVCTVKYTLNHSQNAFATVNTSNFVHVARKLTASNRANVYTRGNIAQRLTHTHPLHCRRHKYTWERIYRRRYENSRKRRMCTEYGQRRNIK